MVTLCKRCTWERRTVGERGGWQQLGGRQASPGRPAGRWVPRQDQQACRSKWQSVRPPPEALWDVGCSIAQLRAGLQGAASCARAPLPDCQAVGSRVLRPSAALR